ncbi:putative phosphatidate cytidylyltransferase [Neolecta irregularis DAH-3]|uniref:Phosphatidate cytidylyltransferase n=1 Tax=Neolecta irregularis (strain DAH-3) TaxID=1198029 RepID=A0A1U7LG82_NEOID|nr:putative phosphatidate cytidylyltransferase [Neolecta irregularis DAH-3]|eukprot:OLL21664.1 putative phosphatidate cytidylyltransferase [Neolecta irregularis DAH-3]
MVITNDIFAYVCGYIWGRTQLIQLSPKKTVEGFIGGWICTIIIGGLISNILMQFKYMICPVKDLGANAFSGVDCIPNSVFTSQTYTISPQIVSSLYLPFNTFNMAPIQFHEVVMATFASLIAPFGGFFASGLKRAFQIKDFGHSIPGHGGMTDRMDCQFLMGFFSYMYYQSFIANPHTTVGSILQTVITQMSHDEQRELVTGLIKYLSGQGIWSYGDVARCLGTG